MILTSIVLDAGLLSLLSVMTIVNIVFVSATHILVRTKFTRPIMVSEFAHMIRIFRGGLPFALATIFSAIYFNFDTVLISKFVGDESAGIYRAAYNLVFPLTMFGLAIAGAVFPFASQNYRSHPQEVENVIRRSVTQLWMISLPIAIATSMFANEIVQLLFPPEFSDAAICLAILVWFLPIVYLTNLYSNTLGAVDRQGYVLWITVLSAAFNVGANVVLVPRYAQVGASVVTVMTSLLAFTFLFIKMRSTLRAAVPFGALLRITAAGVFMIPLFFVRSQVHVLLLLTMSIAVYFCSLLLLRALNLRDLRSLVSSLRSPGGFQEL